MKDDIERTSLVINPIDQTAYLMIETIGVDEKGNSVRKSYDRYVETPFDLIRTDDGFINWLQCCSHSMNRKKIKFTRRI